MARTPSGSTPSGSTPSGSTPSGSTPSGAVPSGSTPSGGNPDTPGFSEDSMIDAMGDAMGSTPNATPGSNGASSNNDTPGSNSGGSGGDSSDVGIDSVDYSNPSVQRKVAKDIEAKTNTKTKEIFESLDPELKTKYKDGGSETFYADLDDPNSKLRKQLDLENNINAADADSFATSLKNAMKANPKTTAMLGAAALFLPLLIYAIVKIKEECDESKRCDIQSLAEDSFKKALDLAEDVGESALDLGDNLLDILLEKLGIDFNTLLIGVGACICCIILMMFVFMML